MKRGYKTLNPEFIEAVKDTDFVTGSHALGDLISERFKKSTALTPEGLQKLTDEIISRDYAGLNQLREELNRAPIKPVLDNRRPMSEGVFYDRPGKSDLEPNIKIGIRNENLPKRLDPDNLVKGVLAHEIGHANDFSIEELDRVRKDNPRRFDRIMKKMAKSGYDQRILDHLNNVDLEKPMSNYALKDGHHLIRKDIKGDTGVYETRNIKRLGRGLGLLGVGAAALMPDISQAAMDTLIPGGVGELGRGSDMPMGVDDTGIVEAIANSPDENINLRRMALKELIRRNKER